MRRAKRAADFLGFCTPRIVISRGNQDFRAAERGGFPVPEMEQKTPRVGGRKPLRFEQRGGVLGNTWYSGEAYSESRNSVSSGGP